MLHRFKKMLFASAVLPLLVGCAGDGGAVFPESASGTLEFASASAAMKILVGPGGALTQLLSVPNATNLNGLGLVLPTGYEDPTAVSFVGLADPYAGCITVTTSPHLKYVMDCQNIVDSTQTYDYVGTIDFIKNDSVNNEYHYEFDYYWFQKKADGTGEGGTYQGMYKYHDDGTLRKTESRISNTFKDNRVNTPGFEYCVNGVCDMDYSYLSNWKVEIDSADDSTDIEGYLGIKGKNNLITGGWTGDINVSFEIKVENLVTTAGGIQSGTMTLIDGTSNKIVITWAGGNITTITYNGTVITI